MTQYTEQDKIIGIYKITSPSGKVYIGQSWNIIKRVNCHKRYKTKGCLKLHSSLLKYGSNDHVFEILYLLPKDTTQKTLDDYEILYISQYKDCGVELLNLKDGGSYGKFSDESKKKMSASGKGKQISESARATLLKYAIGNTVRRGKKASPETIEKLKGRRHSPEVKEKIRLNSIGKKRTGIALENIRAAMNRPEVIEKRKASRIGKKHSEETKRKMSAWQIGRKLPESTREKIRLARLGTKRIKK